VRHHSHNGQGKHGHGPLLDRAIQEKNRELKGHPHSYRGDHRPLISRDEDDSYDAQSMSMGEGEGDDGNMEKRNGEKHKGLVHLQDGGKKYHENESNILSVDGDAKLSHLDHHENGEGGNGKGKGGMRERGHSEMNKGLKKVGEGLYPVKGFKGVGEEEGKAGRVGKVTGDGVEQVS
jgi:hypothetical protein